MKNIALALALLASIAIGSAYAADTAANTGTDVMKGCASMDCCQGCCCCKK